MMQPCLFYLHAISLVARGAAIEGGGLAAQAVGAPGKGGGLAAKAMEPPGNGSGLLGIALPDLGLVQLSDQLEVLDLRRRRGPTLNHQTHAGTISCLAVS